MNIQFMDGPEGWSAAQVASWLRNILPLSEDTIQLFIENDVDGQVLLDHHLNHETLKNDFHIDKFGTRCKILSAIKNLERRGSISTASTTGFDRSTSPSVTGNLNRPRSGEDMASISRRSSLQQSPFIPEDEDIEIRLLDTPLMAQESGGDDGHTSGIPAKGISSYDDGSDSDEPLMEQKRRTVQRRLAATNASTATVPATQPVRQDISVTRPLRRIAPISVSHIQQSSANDGDIVMGLANTGAEDQISPTLVSPTPESTTPNSTSTAADATTAHSPMARRKSAPKYRPQQYLGTRGASLKEFLFCATPGPPSDEEIKEWTVYMGRYSIGGRKQPSQLVQPHLMRPGNKDIVQRNIRRIFRKQPVYDIPGALVYAPIRRREANIDVLLFKGSSVDGSDVQRSTWDEVFSKTAAGASSGTYRAEVPMTQDGFTTEVRLGEAFRSTAWSDKRASTPNNDIANRHHHLPGASRWLPTGEEDVVLPVYGDSDTDDYMTDEELLREIAQEEKEKLRRLKQKSIQKAKTRSPAAPRQVAVSEITEIVEERIRHFKERWARMDLPKLEQREYKIYSKRRDLQEDVEKELEYLETKRLPAWREAIANEDFRSRKHVERVCGALGPTVYLICELQWKLNLFKGPEPIRPTRTVPQPRSPRKVARTEGGDVEHTTPNLDAAPVMEEAGAGTATPDYAHADDDVAMLSEGDMADGDDEDDGADDDDSMEGFIVHDTDEDEDASFRDPAAGEKRQRELTRARKEKRRQDADLAVAPLPKRNRQLASESFGIELVEEGGFDLEMDERRGASPSLPTTLLPPEGDATSITQKLVKSPPPKATAIASQQTSSSLAAKATNTVQDLAPPSTEAEDSSMVQSTTSSPSGELTNFSSSGSKKQKHKKNRMTQKMAEQRLEVDMPNGEEDEDRDSAIMDTMQAEQQSSKSRGGSSSGGRHRLSPKPVPTGRPTDADLQLFGRKSPIGEEERGMDALSRNLGLRPDWLEIYPDQEALIQALTRVRKGRNLGMAVEDDTAFAIYLEYIDWKTIALDDMEDDFKGFLQWKKSGQTRDDLLKDLREKQEEEARLRAAELAHEKAERKKREEEEIRRQREVERERTREQAKAAAERAITIDSDSDLEDSDEQPLRLQRAKERPGSKPRRPNPGKRDKGRREDDQDGGEVDGGARERGGREGGREGRGREGGREERGREKRGRRGGASESTRQYDDDVNDTSGTQETNAGSSVAPRKRVRANGQGRQQRLDVHAPHAQEEVVEDLSSSNEHSDMDQAEDLEQHRRKIIKQQPRPRMTRKAHVEREIIEPEDVIQLREEAAKSQKALEERIREQMSRSAELKRQRSDPNLAGTHRGNEDEIDMDNLVNLGFKEHERPIYFPPWMAKVLKPHQKEGVRFIWRNTVMMENGCILAHSMGLGKSLQVVAFIYLLLRELRNNNPDIPRHLLEGSILIVCPATIAQNWMDEFQKWIPANELESCKVTNFGKDIKFAQRIMKLQKWRSEGGVFIMSNDMFRTMGFPTAGGATSQSQLEVKELIAQLLLDPGPSMMFLDEGHSLKNTQAKLSVVSKTIKTPSRVILTGYPLQNRLEEYWNMVDFVRPNYLADLKTFQHSFIRPIELGLYSDCSKGVRKHAAKRLMVLSNLIKDFVLRKDSSVLVATLPKKVEYVIACSLTPAQRALYLQYLDYIQMMTDRDVKNVIAFGPSLLTICNHPAIFKSAISHDKSKRIGTTAIASASVALATPPGEPEANTQALPSMLMLPQGIGNAEPVVLESEDEVEKQLAEVTAIKEFKFDWDTIPQLNDVIHSNKMNILTDILTYCKMLGEKTLVFSRSILTLNYIEEHVCQPFHFGYKRIDGDVPVVFRAGRVHEFNTNPNIDVFLISTGSGSQGINLVSASRVIIVDIGWNPSVDEQAVARAFRYGQQKPVYVYRLLTHGTWEDKLHKTNIYKLGLFKQVVDEKNTSKNFQKEQMKKYFEPPPEETPQWAASEDRVNRLFEMHPEVDEEVIREIIEQYKESLTLVIPHSQFTLEEQSDLTQEDRDDIQKMLQAEKNRILGVPNPPSPPPNLLPDPALEPLVSAPLLDHIPAEQQQPAEAGPSLAGPGITEPSAPRLYFSEILSVLDDFGDKNMPYEGAAAPTTLSEAPRTSKAATASSSDNTPTSATVIPPPPSSSSEAAWREGMLEELEVMHSRAPMWKPVTWLSNSAPKATNIGVVLERIGALTPQQASQMTGLREEAFGTQPEISWTEAKQMTNATIDVRMLPASPTIAVKMLKGGFIAHDYVHDSGLRRVTIIILNPFRKDLHHVLPPPPPEKDEKSAEAGEEHQQNSLATPHTKSGASRRRDTQLPYHYTPAELLQKLDRNFNDYFTTPLTAIQYAPEAFKFVFVNLQPVM